MGWIVVEHCAALTMGQGVVVQAWYILSEPFPATAGKGLGSTQGKLQGEMAREGDYQVRWLQKQVFASSLDSSWDSTTSRREDPRAGD